MPLEQWPRKQERMVEVSRLPTALRRGRGWPLEPVWDGHTFLESRGGVTVVPMCEVAGSWELGV